MSRAVVIGGGGVAGIAWEIGIIHGLMRNGVSLGDADLILGTSAGAFVGTYLASNETERWFAEQLRGAGREIFASWSDDWATKAGAAVAEGDADTDAACRALGRFATTRQATSTENRMSVVRSRLSCETWPSQALRVTAIDADCGQLHVLDATSRVGILDAVAASGAVPGVWPVVSAGGRRWIDGGCASPNNADRAAGFDTVLVIALISSGLVPHAPDLEEEVAVLRTAGANVEVILPDGPSAAVLGENPFDPAVRPAAARAGERQATRIAGKVLASWDNV